jgi:hypothetical protein
MRDYLEAVRRFHRTWREFFLPRLFEIAPLGVAEYEAMPTFDYPAPRVSALLPQLLGRVAVLFTAAGALLVFATRRLRRVVDA